AIAAGSAPFASKTSPNASAATAMPGLSEADSRASSSAPSQSPAASNAFTRVRRASKPPLPASNLSRNAFTASRGLPRAISSSASARGSVSQKTEAIVQYHRAGPLLDAGAEGNGGAVHPNLDGQRLAREDRLGEAHIEFLDAFRLVFRHAGEDRQAGGAVGTEPMQNGARKAHRLGHCRIAVKRVAVAGERVEKRLVGPCVAFLDQVGGARWQGVKFRTAALLSAEAAIAAGENGRDDGEQFLAAGLVAHHALLHQDGAPSFALVQNLQHAFVGHDVGLGLKGLVKGDAALAIHHHHEIDRGFLRHALALGRRLAAID